MAQFKTEHKGTGRNKQAAKYKITSTFFNTSFTLSARDYTEESAQDCRLILTEIERARKVGDAFPDDLNARIDGRPHFKRRLIEKGILDGTDDLTVEELCKRYLDAQTSIKGNFAENTLRNKTYRAERLIDFFRPETKAVEIDERGALAYRKWLDCRYAEATRAGYIKGAKEIFRWAINEAGILRKSPFERVAAGSMANEERKRFVPLDVYRKLLDACDAQEHWTEQQRREWRVLLAFSRICGMRITSESNAARWEDVDFENGVFTVRAGKTARYEGKGKRVIPLFPELRQELESLYEIRDKSSPFVLTLLRTKSNVGTMLRKLVYRAGLEEWPRIFHNLRASRDTELRDDYNDHVINKWIGHSQQIAEAHYLKVRDKDLKRGAKNPTQTDEEE